MGSGPSRRYQNELIVMIDVTRAGVFEGPLLFGRVTGACAALERNNWEYTIAVEDSVSECVPEQFFGKLRLPELDFVSERTREVGVWVETHGTKRFAANLVRRDEDLTFEVKFLADGTVLTGVAADHLAAPDEQTLYDVSPQSVPADPLWLLDRKVQANIDINWPMPQRIMNALAALQKPRPSHTPPLCGPFLGKSLTDSEGFPAHPAPLPELSVDGVFVDTWARYAGKIKFATNWGIGPSHPRFDAWCDSIDAGDPLYLHAALPVYAGLICLGRFQGQPEWVRASDVALVGIALYVNGELHPGFPDPPIEKLGKQQYGHECCHFIPGCVSTYFADCGWVGAVFCLGPSEKDMEVRDDIYSILAYHQILREWPRRLREAGKRPEITLDVNLILSTNYLANIRQVCCSSVRIRLTDRGLMVANLRIRDVLENRLNSEAAYKPRRQRKSLAEASQESKLEEQLAANFGRSAPAPPPGEPPGSMLTGGARKSGSRTPPGMQTPPRSNVHGTQTPPRANLHGSQTPPMRALPAPPVGGVPAARVGGLAPRPPQGSPHRSSSGRSPGPAGAGVGL